MLAETYYVVLKKVAHSQNLPCFTIVLTLVIELTVSLIFLHGQECLVRENYHLPQSAFALKISVSPLSVVSFTGSLDSLSLQNYSMYRLTSSLIGCSASRVRIDARECRRMQAMSSPYRRGQCMARCFSARDGSKNSDSEEQHRLYQEQMQELKDEREALFGFTEDERNAWSNATEHKHEFSFLEKIEQARAQQMSQKKDHIAELSSRVNGPPEAELPYRGLSHLSKDGTSIHMVDVGRKTVSRRTATAQSRVVLPLEVIEAFAVDERGNMDLVGPKGPIFATAKLAGIMAAK